MKNVLPVLLLLSTSLVSFSQNNKSIWEINQMKLIDPAQKENASKYLQLNWMRTREYSVKNGLIASYQVLFRQTDPKDNNPDWDVMLVTEYKDTGQVHSYYDNYSEILKKANPDGPIKVDGKNLMGFLKPVSFTVLDKKVIEN